MKKYFILSILLFLLIKIFVYSEIKYDTTIIEQAIKKQLKRYPKSTLGDIYKNFYQDRFGTEHLIADTQSVYNYITNELQKMDTTYCDLIEEIGWEHNCVRISLELLKENKINEQNLASAFIQTGKGVSSLELCENWIKEWEIISTLCEKYEHQIKDFRTDKKDIDSILAINPKAAIHHSKDYNAAYKPHYRVIKKEYLKKLGLDEK